MKNKEENLEALEKACAAAGLPLYGKDFMLRAIAILYCYGGGPGGEHFRAPFAHAVIMKAGEMVYNAVLEKDWPVVSQFRQYVRELQEDRAEWLNRTLEKLSIPAREIKFMECVQQKSPGGC